MSGRRAGKGLLRPFAGCLRGLTRSSRLAENVRRTCEQYKLTPGEREAVLLLTQGLTSEEIARRMDSTSPGLQQHT
jgi:DNA-binding CsgD family transcriptional regulator